VLPHGLHERALRHPERSASHRDDDADEDESVRATDEGRPVDAGIWNRDDAGLNDIDWIAHDSLYPRE
jgi:hypothetical protein